MSESKAAEVAASASTVETAGPIAAKQKTRLWRCYNQKCADKPGVLGHDFTGDAPVCDKCGCDGRTPKFAGKIVSVKVIHYDPPGPMENVGVGFIACDPTKPVGAYLASGSPPAVNCPQCRATREWKDADAAIELHPHDVLTIDPSADCGCK